MSPHGLYWHVDMFAHMVLDRCEEMDSYLDAMTPFFTEEHSATIRRVVEQATRLERTDLADVFDEYPDLALAESPFLDGFPSLLRYSVIAA